MSIGKNRSRKIVSLVGLLFVLCLLPLKSVFSQTSGNQFRVGLTSDNYEAFTRERMQTARHRQDFQESIQAKFTEKAPSWDKVPILLTVLESDLEGEGEGEREGEREGESSTKNAEAKDSKPESNKTTAKTDTKTVPKKPAVKSGEQKKSSTTDTAEEKENLEPKSPPKKKFGHRVKSVGNKIKGFMKDTFDGRDKE